MSAAKESPKQIEDVARPGKTAPPLTSKPVLVTNRTILKDPMVVDDTPKPEPKAEPAKAATEKEVAVSDIAPAEPVAEEKIEPKSEHVVQPLAQPKAEPAKEPEPETTPTKTPESAAEAPKTEPQQSTSSDENDDTIDSATMTDAQIEAEAAAVTARDTQIQKLIDSKQYYVPVNAVEKRRTKRVIALGIVLSIILALAWVDIALDAGLIELGSVKPVTHFFSN